MVNGQRFSSPPTTESALQHMLHSPTDTHIHILMTEAAMKGADLLTIFPLKLPCSLLLLTVVKCTFM